MDENIDELRRVLNDSLSVTTEEGAVALRVAQIITLYFYPSHAREARERVATISERFLQRWGHRLKWILEPDTDRMERFGPGKGSEPRAWLLDHSDDEDYSLIYHSEVDAHGAGEYCLYISGVQRRPVMRFGFLHITLPLLEFADGDGSLAEVLLDLCGVLKPFSGYGGVGIADSISYRTNYRFGPIVYHWGQRFPGLEVDYPVRHSIWLPEGREGERDGIKGVNWLTVIGDRYLPELGGAEKVMSDLAALDSGFKVYPYDGGLIIQAGTRPQLGDGRIGRRPALYVKLARYLKPIRVTRHPAFQRGGPDIEFDQERSEAWLRRFDDREV